MATRRGGFDCEFVESPPKIVQSECPVCLLVLCEPYQVTCCGYSYCKACIERVKADNEPCPCCKNDFDDFPNKGLQRSLSGFKVFCSHHKEGCQWIGEFGQLESHFNVDPPQQWQLEGCTYVEVPCQYCFKLCKRSQALVHQSELCPLRPFTCQYCKVFHSYYEDVVSNHMPRCGCCPVACPNKCGATILLKDVERHVSDDCPLTVLTVQVRRKDLPPYQVLVSAHVSEEKLLLQRFERENAELKQQLVKLSTYNCLAGQSVPNLHTHLGSVPDPVSQSEGASSPAVLSDPIQLTLSNFTTLKDKDRVWCSSPFYARGYKLCAVVAANGLRVGKNTHVSVLIYLMRGTSDSTLRWPFRGIITLQLNDQTGEDHIAHVVDFSSESCHKAGNRVSMWRDRSSVGLGKYEFVSHEDLCPKYLRDNCLYFQISKIELP